MKIKQRELDSLRKVRNYFGEHDKTIFEHSAYRILDDLFKKLQDQKAREHIDSVLPDEICNWGKDVGNNNVEWYMTGCNNMHNFGEFTDIEPEEFNYCPYCGKKLSCT